MKFHKSFLELWMLPATETHKEYVRGIYPNAYFKNGLIYDGSNDWKQLTTNRWDLSGVEAEYYAWLWAYDMIGVEMLRKLES